VPKNARLTPQGRALLVRRIHAEGWRVGDAAAAGISERTAFRWRGIGRRACPAGAQLGARPMPAPTLLGWLRSNGGGGSGPQIARQLNLPRSTVGAVLRRLGLGKLAARVPKPEVIRYQRDRPGALLHIDIKKLGRIDGVGPLTAERIMTDNVLRSEEGWLAGQQVPVREHALAA
jgi:leucine-zipper of insertion element IS481